MFQVGQKVIWRSTGGDGMTHEIAATIIKINKRITLWTTIVVAAR